MAGEATRTALSGAVLHELRAQLVIEAAAALLVLFVATIRYGWRKQHQRELSQP
jgi:hypothetical protein